jgi:hypothetical protein
MPPTADGYCCQLGGGSVMDAEKITVPEGFKLIFRATKRDKDGNLVYAKNCGLRAFPLVVPVDK